VSSLVDIATLTEKCIPYIKRRKGQTEKAPSDSLTGPDGPSDDCTGNR